MCDQLSIIHSNNVALLGLSLEWQCHVEIARDPLEISEGKVDGRKTDDYGIGQCWFWR